VCCSVDDATVKPPWTFIAGALEDGESPQQTAARECREETELTIEPGEGIGEGNHPKTGRHMVCVACRPVNDTQIVVGDPDELAKVAWRGLADLDELMPYGVFEPAANHLQRVLN
jgi:8-oxo-dGTP pyrophosphatase MutT (NUDIX family)